MGGGEKSLTEGKNYLLYPFGDNRCQLVRVIVVCVAMLDHLKRRRELTLVEEILSATI